MSGHCAARLRAQDVVAAEHHRHLKWNRRVLPVGARRAGAPHGRRSQTARRPAALQEAGLRAALRQARIRRARRSHRSPRRARGCCPTESIEDVPSAPGRRTDSSCGRSRRSASQFWIAVFTASQRRKRSASKRASSAARHAALPGPGCRVQRGDCRLDIGEVGLLLVGLLRKTFLCELRPVRARAIGLVQIAAASAELRVEHGAVGGILDHRVEAPGPPARCRRRRTHDRRPRAAPARRDRGTPRWRTARGSASRRRSLTRTSASGTRRSAGCGSRETPRRTDRSRGGRESCCCRRCWPS